MIEGCVSWYQWFAPKAGLEFADDSVDVVRDPRMHVRTNPSTLEIVGVTASTDVAESLAAP